MTSLTVLRADALYTPDRVEPPVIAVADGLVVATGVAAARLGDPVAVTGTIVPAMVDLQVNGGDGVDLQQPEPDRRRLHRWLAAGGVLTYAPTLVSAPLARMAALASGLAGEVDGVLALKPHFEGPFLSGSRLGAHDRAAVSGADAAKVGEVAAALASYVTLAPEREGAGDLVRRLVAAGVPVSAGHSDATQAEAEAGMRLGITQVTHLFNAMRPMHHREPGLAGAALMGPAGPSVGVIADGVHVSPSMVLLASRLLGDRMYLVSDAVAAAGRDGESRLSDGTLAGSVTRLDEGLRNLLSWGIDPVAAVTAVTAAPAAAAGLSRRGRLAPGYSDLVALVDAGWMVRCAGPAADLLAATVKAG